TFQEGENLNSRVLREAGERALIDISREPVCLLATTPVTNETIAKETKLLAGNAMTGRDLSNGGFDAALLFKGCESRDRGGECRHLAAILPTPWRSARTRKQGLHGVDRNLEQGLVHF